MARLSRRTFLKTSAATGALFAIGGTRASGQVRGANDRIRIAIAGVNGRGKSHIDEFAGMRGVEVAYVVDPDSRLYDRTVKRIEDRSEGRSKPKTVADIRAVLDDPNVDAITIATPNHWHALMTIWACQAGKDVYVEKPCSHNVYEGRVAVEAARRNKRIVQHGTQSRSSNGWARAVAAVKSGQYGTLKVSRAIVYKRRDSIGFESTKAPPAELDFNIWLGPAPEQPYHENLVHYDWHWFWDFGNGDIGNQGVHQMDIARWGIPGATWPTSVVSLGGRFGYEDQGETPNTQLTVFDYGDTQLIFEVRGLVPKNHIDNVFHFADGEIRDGKFYRNGSEKGEELPEVKDRGPGDGHFANFIAAVRSRKTEDLNAPIEEGHYSSGLCHLANISYRLGEPVPFDRRSGQFRNNEAASETFARMQDHLKEKGVKLDQEQYYLGRHLTFDARREQFQGDPAANELLTREYRNPFTIPQELARAAAS
jgi:predicted dehydrogenase